MRRQCGSGFTRLAASVAGFPQIRISEPSEAKSAARDEEAALLQQILSDFRMARCSARVAGFFVSQSTQECRGHMSSRCGVPIVPTVQAPFGAQVVMMERACPACATQPSTECSQPSHILDIQRDDQSRLRVTGGLRSFRAASQSGCAEGEPDGIDEARQNRLNDTLP